MNPAANRRGIILVASAAASISLLPVLFRASSRLQLGIGTQLAARLLLGALALILWNRFFRHHASRDAARPNRETRWLAAASGLVLFAAFTTYTASINLGTPPVKAILIIYTSPIITALLARIFLKEALTRRKLVTIFGGVLGVLISIGFWNVAGLYTFQTGDLFALANALATATIPILGRRSAALHNRFPLVGLEQALVSAAFWGLLCGAVIGISAPANPELWSISWKLEAVLMMLGLGLAGTATPYILLYNGLKHLEASAASIILLLEPVCVVFLQVFLLHEPVQWYQVLGGVILLACGYAVQAGAPQKLIEPPENN